MSPAADRDVLSRALDEITGEAACAAVVTVDDEHGTWSAARGLADVPAHRPATPQDRFRAGSIVKTFVAATVLQLVGEGVLRLSDTVADWLPGTVPDGDRISLRQLLNHTSGLYDVIDAMPVSPAHLAGVARLHTIAPDRLVRAATACPPHFPPGAGWRYSNTNYVLAGMLIERATGRPYEEEVRRRIVGALGLRHTVLPATSPFLPGPHLRAYLWPGRPAARPLLDITVQNPSRAWASGDLVSTAGDLTYFLSELLAGRLLPPPLMDEMLSTVPGTNDRDYGLGLFRMSVPGGTRVWGNSGAYGGYVTFMLRSEDRARGATISVTPRSGAAIQSVLKFAVTYFGA
ncbi:serine hydrolase domain-containing protein [Cryptosporangium sp. NPDC051539]|uniref:serine hydrolase domain-containing protein n=1 Tax=Cryptosporangium sp. NPDC051539 TaxID=3363962 RepID=UPI0037931E07